PLATATSTWAGPNLVDTTGPSTFADAALPPEPVVPLVAAGAFVAAGPGVAGAPGEEVAPGTVAGAVLGSTIARFPVVRSTTGWSGTLKLMSRMRATVVIARAARPRFGIGSVLSSVGRPRPGR